MSKAYGSQTGGQSDGKSVLGSKNGPAQEGEMNDSL